MTLRKKLMYIAIGVVIVVAIVIAIVVPLTVLKDSKDSPYGTCDNVTYYYFSRSNFDQHKRIGSCNISELRLTNFNKGLKNYFGVHGSNDNYKSTLFMKNLLNVTDINLFLVDYRGLAVYSGDRTQGAIDTGYVTANYIKLMQKEYNLKGDDFVCVGFSLGTHVCGEVGRNLNSDLDAIVALDPGNRNPSYIEADRAKYVQCIHTSATGLQRPAGVADYFANTIQQPGCNGDEECNHFRSTLFYAESILTGGFTSTKCQSYEHFVAGNCNSNEKSYLGRVNLDRNARGSYYLTTNKESPFSKG